MSIYRTEKENGFYTVRRNSDGKTLHFAHGEKVFFVLEYCAVDAVFELDEVNMKLNGVSIVFA
jgi:hypothetical protein